MSSSMRVTARVEITDSKGNTLVHEESISGAETGDNPHFFATDFERAIAETLLPQIRQVIATKFGDLGRTSSPSREG